MSPYGRQRALSFLAIAWATYSSRPGGMYVSLRVARTYVGAVSSPCHLGGPATSVECIRRPPVEFPKKE